MGASILAERAVASSPITVSIAEDGPRWDAFVEQHSDATIDHLWGWRAVFRDVFRHDSRYLIAHRGGDAIGVLPLVLMKSRLFGRCVVSLPMLDYGGLVVSDRAAVPPLVERATEITRSFGARYLELRHRAPLTTLPSKQHKVSMRLTLPATSDGLWSALDRKVRNQVRKAQKSDMTVETGGAPLVDAFYRVFSENMRDLGTPVYPKSLFTAAFATFPGRVRAFVVRQGDRAVAAAVALVFRDTVLVPWASSLRAFRQLCPNMLLYWSMLEWAAASRLKVFDFGRSTPGGGTYEFKLQWGAVPEPQCWEYALAPGEQLPEHGPDNARFDAAIAAWKRLPLGLTVRLGPSIVRHIP